MFILQPSQMRESTKSAGLMHKASRDQDVVRDDSREPASGPTFEALAPGAIVGGAYCIEEEIGRGARGVVYLARDIWLDRKVALKLVASRNEQSLDDDGALQSAARALAAVRNEHVVRIYAFGSHGNSYFIAMEHIEGDALDVLLDQYARTSSVMPPHRAATIVAALARGLDALHANGFVHQDVKPNNIIIEEGSGRPVLVDFGLALVNDSFDLELVESNLCYIAPEQIFPDGDEFLVGPWTDQYSLACVALEMLTGEAPRVKGSLPLELAHACKAAPPASRVDDDAAGFNEVLARALATSADVRYPSCGAFAAELLKLASAERRSSPPPTFRAHESGDSTLHILVVDDDQAFARFAGKAAQLAAQKRSVRISTAQSGREAIDSAQALPPDFILLDLDMPHLDGLETLSRLRALPRGEAARVIVLSGKLGPHERWRFSVMGVRDFIAKPVDLRSLVDMISSLLAHEK